MNLMGTNNESVTNLLRDNSKTESMIEYLYLTNTAYAQIGKFVQIRY